MFFCLFCLIVFFFFFSQEDDLLPIHGDWSAGTASILLGTELGVNG